MNIKEIDEKLPGLFTELDRQFADFMQLLSGSTSPELVMASRILSNLTGKGNICVHIPSISGKDIQDVLGAERESDSKDKNFILYSANEWLLKLKESPVTGTPGDFKPLILDNKSRLYLYRYWQYEQKLALNIKKRLELQCDINIDTLKKCAAGLFPNGNDIEQQIASIGSMLRRFYIISGGPGTGKTSSIIKIISLMINAGGPGSLRIAVAAPTGKATARLNESLKNAFSSSISDKITQNIPVESFTIHRLLGPIHGSPYFRYNGENQLPYDVVIVDESSMADLALLSKLFESIPEKSKIILLGDKDQLASVEAGAAFGDICDTGRVHTYSAQFINELAYIASVNIDDILPIGKKAAPPISDSIMILRRSYRFGKESGIGELAATVRDGDTDRAIELLRGGDFPDISFYEKIPQETFVSLLSKRIISGYSPYLNAATPEGAIGLFSGFTILCAVRKGYYGVEHINSLAEDILHKNRLISKNNEWYSGRPVMVVKNEYNLKLYNGDIGIILPDPEAGSKTRFFSHAADGTIRKILPLKLPEHETVYAMTVHKSQGSEFGHIILLLPDFLSPVLTRELLYTAITRARKKVEIFGAEAILRYMISNPTARTSGLKDALWKA